MPNDGLFGIKQHCVICTAEISPERLKRKSITCSDEHHKLRKRLMRVKVINRECTFCHKPSTPSQRRAFTRFIQWERSQPDQAYPEVWKIVAAAAEPMTLKAFGRAVVQAAEADVTLDVSFADEDWGAVKGYDEATNPELQRCLELLSHHAAQKAPNREAAPAPPKAEEAAE